MPRPKGLSHRDALYAQRKAKRDAETTGEPIVPPNATTVANTVASTSTAQEPMASTSTEPVASTSAASLPTSDELPSTSTIPLNPTVRPTKRRRIISPPARASTRIAHRQQPAVREPTPEPIHQDPIAVAIEHRRTAEKLCATYCAARLCNSVIQYISIGDLNNICQFCGALLFACEFKDRSSQLCCHKGKIKLEPVDVPPVLQTLIEQNKDETHKYLDNIRQYNSALAFASVTAEAVNFPSRGPYCFKVHGQIYHSVGSLQVPQGQKPSYASLFIIDAETALGIRMEQSANRDCSPHLMQSLQDLLQEFNPYAQLFQHVSERAQNCQQFQLNFHLDNAFDRRRYNAPTAQGEIAAVFTSTDGAPPGKYDFVIYSKSTGSLSRINNLNPHCDPMCYPLLFPCGDAGWKPGMAHVEIHRSAARHTTTQLQFYCYRLAVRAGFNLLHSSGKLFQQYVVDSYVKVEGARISFIRTHQKELRAETYKGLQDYMLNDEQGFAPGVPVILPSTFIGSPRNMIQNYQDAMCIVSRFGKPDLFITFTCNPKWKEIVDNMKPYEQVCNRPDLVARVFYAKLYLLLDDLLKHHVLGIVLADVHVIEFQKRGLPHAHILLILREADKVRDPAHVDSIVCAEIPDPEQDPELHAIITQSMIHGPCGQMNLQSPCMDGDKCSKKIPKDFVDETILNVNGYPLYRRRNNGRTILKNNFFLDNRWVVPYNKWLSKKYAAHVNVEICSTVSSVKYLYKYVYKGHDCAAMHLRQNNDNNLQTDELGKFINCRYVSPPEAMWRLHERPLYRKSHTIQRLPIHLPDEQMIYFQAEDVLNVDLQHEKFTKLTAFFKLCQDNVTARQYVYSEIPEHFVWIKGEWATRQRFTRCIGRIYTVNPIDKERFSLRLLLLHVKGPTSFDFLKTVDGVLCTSFSEAATKMNLLDNDREWYSCLQEASTFQLPKQLRQLFGIICVFASPTDVNQLWDTFKQSLAEDYRRTHDENASLNMALLDIKAFFKMHGRSCADFGLPTPILPEHPTEEPVNCQEEAEQGRQMYDQLNVEQRNIVDEILLSVEHGAHQTFFVDGPGGTGKTFVYETLTHTLRGQGKSVLSVAWTGIAAKLLQNGTTAHSAFQFPVPLTENSVSSLRLNSKQARVIRDASIIIWDEVSMVTKDALSVLDRLLRELTDLDMSYGGKIIVFGGDFRQVLPVVRRGNRVTIVESCVKSSPLWPQVARRKLTTNMRAADDVEFATWLLSLGDGSLPIQQHVTSESVEIPKRCYCPPKELVTETFGSNPIDHTNIGNLLHTAILCAKNDDCSKLNDHIVHTLIRGESKTYLSLDSVQSEDPQDVQLYPTEFLNSIDPSGLPPHKLVLKVNTIVMLIRNLNSKRGLVNGLRLIVKQLNEFNIVAQTIDTNEFVIIPRIVLTPSDPSMPFKLTRKQFPIKIAFAITINKAQGQTLDKAGIFLPNPVFAHGQLYVAFSRVRSFADVKVAVEEGPDQVINETSVITSNIVYKEIL